MVRLDSTSSPQVRSPRVVRGYEEATSGGYFCLVIFSLPFTPLEIFAFRPSFFCYAVSNGVNICAEDGGDGY